MLLWYKSERNNGKSENKCKCYDQSTSISRKIVYRKNKKINTVKTNYKLTYVEVDRNLQIPKNDANMKNNSMGSSKIYWVNVNVPTSIIKKKHQFLIMIKILNHKIYIYQIKLKLMTKLQHLMNGSFPR